MRPEERMPARARAGLAARAKQDALTESSVTGTTLRSAEKIQSELPWFYGLRAS